MISFIKGTVESYGDDSVVIENNGIGYSVQVSPATLGKLPRDKEVKLYTYMNVKENGIDLFGFAAPEEIRIFNLLISVSGVGPKSALAIVAAMSAEKIMLAIVTDDAATLSKAPGIGKKTAQRLILELKDKIVRATGSLNQADYLQGVPQGADYTAGGARQDAVEALVALGYSRSEAYSAVMAIADAADDENMQTEQILKLALKKLAK